MRPVTAVLFDFDGTLSTLRAGWESVMEPMMREILGEESAVEIRNYINESTGIQTILQMKWLAERVRQRNKKENPGGFAGDLQGEAANPWQYKAEYNRRLMEMVSVRRAALADGSASREDFLIQGSEVLLHALHERGIDMYVASGTDDPDVKAEAELLGLSAYFKTIAGAPPGSENCSKEKVIRGLMQAGIAGGTLAVVGDGKVEIAVGRENGARTLGVASDEIKRTGIDPVKYERLVKAGADKMVGDFLELDGLMEFFC